MVGVAAGAHVRWLIRKSLIFETTLLTPEVAEFQCTVATLLIALNSGGACCRATCRATAVRILSMMSGRVTSAMTRNLPPQFGQIDRSIAPVRTANGMLIAMQSAEYSAQPLHPRPFAQRTEC
jgi:hypothetical protein